jgi:hypothetical protein
VRVESTRFRRPVTVYEDLQGWPQYLVDGEVRICPETPIARELIRMAIVSMYDQAAKDALCCRLAERGGIPPYIDGVHRPCYYSAM